MREYKLKEMKTLLNRNGWEHMRNKGDHYIYKKGNETIVITKVTNGAVAGRLIKKYNLK